MMVMCCFIALATINKYKTNQLQKSVLSIPAMSQKEIMRQSMEEKLKEIDLLLI